MAPRIATAITPWVEVATELVFGLEARKQLFEELDRNVDVPTVDAPLTVGRDTAVRGYVDDGYHAVPVLTHESEDRLDVRAKRGRPGRFGKDARDYVGPASFDDLDHDLPDEVVLTGEVLTDDAFADADPPRDASKGGLSEARSGSSSAAPAGWAGPPYGRPTPEEVGQIRRMSTSEPSDPGDTAPPN
jgi:hypothetical protein